MRSNQIQPGKSLKPSISPKIREVLGQSRPSRARSRDSQKCDSIFDGTEFDDCRIDAVNIARWIQNCKIEICGTVDAFEGQVQYRSMHFILEFRILSNV